MDIIQAIEDPNLFGSLFKDPKTWATWRVFLKGLFGLEMAPEEVSTFSRYTGRASPPLKPASEAWVIAGRRSGKSFMSALIACYLAIFRDWTPFLAAGEQAFVMVIAADRRQAKVVLRYVKGILNQRLFRTKVLKELDEEIQLSNRVTISVKTADFRTLRGFTCAAAICDEMAFWRSGETSAQPAEEILLSLRPALATIPESLMLCISSPYARTGPLYEAHREKYGQDIEGTLVWKSETTALNPTIRQGVIDRAVKEDPAAARAEWFAEFREDLESFLTADTVERAIVPGRAELPMISGATYAGFVDPSGGKSDSFTLAVAHLEEDGRAVLDCLKERRPPFTPLDVVKEYADILKSYRVYRVSGDRYAGAWVQTAFEDNGIHYDPSELSKSEIYLNAEPLLNQGKVELLDIPRLALQLRALERRTRTAGKDQVDHGPGGHDDAANAAAGALVAAAKTRGMESWGISWIDVNTGQITSPEMPEEPPEYLPLNDEGFAVRYLAAVRKFGMIAPAARFLGKDPELIKRWVQDNRGRLDSVLAYRGVEICKIYETME